MEKAGNVGQCHETKEGGSLGCEERAWARCRFEAVTMNVCLNGIHMKYVLVCISALMVIMCHTKLSSIRSSSRADSTGELLEGEDEVVAAPDGHLLLHHLELLRRGVEVEDV